MWFSDSVSAKNVVIPRSVAAWASSSSSSDPRPWHWYSISYHEGHLGLRGTKVAIEPTHCNQLAHNFDHESQLVHVVDGGEPLELQLAVRVGWKVKNLR